MYRSDWLFIKTFFFRRQINVKSLLKTLTLHMIVIEPAQCMLNRKKKYFYNDFWGLKHAGRMSPVRAFCADRDAFWEFWNN